MTSKEHSATIETSIVRDAEGYFVRVAFDGTTRINFGPMEQKHDAQELATATMTTVRTSLEYLLGAQRFAIRDQ